MMAYACEQLFSKKKYAKSRFKARLCNDRQAEVLLLSSRNIPPDVKKLPKNKQNHVSHKII